MHTFSEGEAREVFARAAREHQAAGDAAASAAGGLTLDELAQVGEASGIPRAFVVAAARAVAHGVPESGRETRAGVPTGVRHTAFLPAPPSDDLWEAVVVDARRTFAARGKTATVGRAREWRNGHLAVTLEPAADGSRLQLQTRRTDAAPIVRLSAFFAVVGLVVALVGGAWAPGLAIALLCAVAGGATWARQRAWAATREGQMRGLGERAATLAARDAVATPGGETPVAERTSAPETVPASALLDLDGLGDAPDDTPAARSRTRS